jgi:hypothetical protein
MRGARRRAWHTNTEPVRQVVVPSELTGNRLLSRFGGSATRPTALHAPGSAAPGDETATAELGAANEDDDALPVGSSEVPRRSAYALALACLGVFSPFCGTQTVGRRGTIGEYQDEKGYEGRKYAPTFSLVGFRKEG